MAAAPSIGIIRIDYDSPSMQGDISEPGTFACRVYYRVVSGLTFEICKAGAMPPDVKREFIEAIEYLRDRGVSCITSNCGFMLHFQELARQHCTLPVFMSSLAVLPAVTCCFHSRELIAIFTANSRALEPMRRLIRQECGVDTQGPRFVIVGCEDVAGFEAVALMQAVDVDLVRPGVVAKARAVQARHPQLRAILFECAPRAAHAQAAHRSQRAARALSPRLPRAAHGLVHG